MTRWPAEGLKARVQQCVKGSTLEASQMMTNLWGPRAAAEGEKCGRAPRRGGTSAAGDSERIPTSEGRGHEEPQEGK